MLPADIEMSKYQTPTAELLLTLQFHPIQSIAELQEVQSTKATDELRAQYGHVQCQKYIQLPQQSLK